MNFKQETNGTYSVHFEAKELPSIVRMVAVMEKWKQETALQGQWAAEEATTISQSNTISDTPKSL